MFGMAQAIENKGAARNLCATQMLGNAGVKD